MGQKSKINSDSYTAVVFYYNSGNKEIMKLKLKPAFARCSLRKDIRQNLLDLYRGFTRVTKS